MTGPGVKRKEPKDRHIEGMARVIEQDGSRLVVLEVDKETLAYLWDSFTYDSRWTFENLEQENIMLYAVLGPIDRTPRDTERKAAEDALIGPSQDHDSVAATPPELDTPS